MYYTRGGDGGSSKLFEAHSRRPKSDQIFEVLGTLDELNSFLGLARSFAGKHKDIQELLKTEQNHLFSLQAHFAGAKVDLPDDLVLVLEEKIAEISAKLKKRSSFVIPGESSLSAFLDVLRTISRRAEREALKLEEEEKHKKNKQAFVYLNRLSSFFYVLARYLNDLYDLSEEAPSYN